MKTRLLLLATALLFSSACDSASPVAPSGTVLFVTANPQRIGVNGTSTITVTGFRPDGNPIHPGTQLRLTTSLGSIAPTVVVADNSGQAIATLQADGRSGMATVEATLITSGGGSGGSTTGGTTTGGETTGGETTGGGGGGGADTTSNTVQVTIGESADSKPTLEVTVSPATVVLGETATVRILARNPDGSRFGAGGIITLTSSLGTISPTQVTTDAQGEATSTFAAGNQVGTATISANLGSADTATADVVIENQLPQLLLFANPTTIPLNGTSQVTIIARDSNGNPLGAGERIRLAADLGTIRSEVFTDANGEAEATFRGGDRSGTGSVTAIVGNSEPTSVDIVIQEGPDDILVTATQNPISRNSGMTTINVVVVNSSGQGVSGAIVNFSIRPSAGVDATFDPDSRVLTDVNGRASVDLTVISAPSSEDSITVVASASAQGETETGEVEIMFFD